MTSRNQRSFNGDGQDTFDEDEFEIEETDLGPPSNPTEVMRLASEASLQSEINRLVFDKQAEFLLRPNIMNYMKLVIPFHFIS